LTPHLKVFFDGLRVRKEYRKQFKTGADTIMAKPIKIGLIGFGNIGTAVVNALNRNGRVINERLPRPIKLVRIADIDLKRKREAKYDRAMLTARAQDILDDPQIEIVIELIGGIEPARSYIRRALMNRKHVVTANKALLAEHGAELLQLAHKQKVALLFEASVGAGIPIIRSLQDSFCANRIKSIFGIINGTANYILTNMTEKGSDFRGVLREAQRLGYAEPDPTFDIEGYDSAHKIAILASLAFGQDIRFRDVFVQGITNLQQIDLAHAGQMGYVIKLLGIAKTDAKGKVSVRVHPTLVRKSSMLASVGGVYNAIMVDAEPVGRQMFYGRGAGGGSTSSAVLGDVMKIAEGIARGGVERENRLRIAPGVRNIKPIEELETAYYLRISALDKPGTMARLSAVLGKNDISIASVIQPASPAPSRSAVRSRAGRPAQHPVVTKWKSRALGRRYALAIIVTHRAKEARIQRAAHEIARLPVTRGKPFILRVEDEL
jgi:homoserine dehydrogenase